MPKGLAASHGISQIIWCSCNQLITDRHHAASHDCCTHCAQASHCSYFPPTNGIAHTAGAYSWLNKQTKYSKCTMKKYRHKMTPMSSPLFKCLHAYWCSLHINSPVPYK